MNKTYRAVSSIVLRRLPLQEQLKSTLSDNRKEITRKPTELLYLVVKKPRQDHAWQFPQGGQDPGETGSEAALRELEEECGSDLQVRLVGTTPIGVYQYEFPADFKRSKKYIGAKVSFYVADWIEGQCEPDNKEIVDFGWLTKEEVFDLVHQDYRQAIQSFL